MTLAGVCVTLAGVCVTLAGVCVTLAGVCVVYCMRLRDISWSVRRILHEAA